MAIWVNSGVKERSDEWGYYEKEYASYNGNDDYGFSMPVAFRMFYHEWRPFSLVLRETDLKRVSSMAMSNSSLNPLGTQLVVGVACGLLT